MKSNDLETINVVWFKRDLRLTDHRPLALQADSQLPTLLLYVFEPDVINDPHYSERHWRFVYQSLKTMQMSLGRLNTKVLIAVEDIQSVINKLNSVFAINAIYTYQEIGVDVTFTRDKLFTQYCNNNGIQWHQTPHSTVKRSALRREIDAQHWHSFMQSPPDDPEHQNIKYISTRRIQEIECLFKQPLPETWQKDDAQMQHGGERWAWHTLKDFFKARGKDYQRHISRPHDARYSCTRVSPYIAWGNLSLRQVYQYTLDQKERLGKPWNRPINAMISRLHWHDHFLQKFECEPEMQFYCRNKAYEKYPYETDTVIIQTRLDAWKRGETGIPIVDANMRAVIATGYINFRMRAMLVSFLTLHLNIDWRLGVHHLAQQFLDFEPGIHYAQFQMQAGVTGIHTIRLYNPIKQSEEKDDKAVFIKKWCPELANLPLSNIHTPWNRPVVNDLFEPNIPDVDYPKPIIDVSETAKTARDRAWSFRERDDVRREARRLLTFDI